MKKTESGPGGKTAAALLPLSEFFVEHDISPTQLLADALRQQPYPLQYAKRKWEQCAKRLMERRPEKGLTGAENIFFTLVVLLEASPLPYDRSKWMEEVKGLFKALEEIERGRTRLACFGPLLSRKQSVLLVKNLCEALEKWGLLSDSGTAPLLELAMHRISPTLQRELTKANGATGELARFYCSGLPITDDYYAKWFAGDEVRRQELVRFVLENKRRFLHGNPFPHVREKLELAYAAFGPSPLVSRKAFVERLMRIEKEPEIFLPGDFTLEIEGETGAVDIHRQIDKRIIEKGFENIRAFSDPEFLAAFVKSLFEYPGLRGLGPLKAALEQIREHFDDDNLKERVMGLLNLLSQGSKADSVRGGLILQLVLGLAMQSLENQSFVINLKQYKTGFAYSSEHLQTLLRQLRTFYFETVQIVLEKMSEGVLSLQVPWIRQYRRELETQCARIQETSVEPQTVHIWPWRSAAAIFSGAFRPNCIKPENLEKEIYHGGKDRTRFQVNIIEADGTLLGFIYAKSAFIGGEPVLLLGIEPKTDWRVGKKALLKAVIREYSKIAERESYAKLLFSMQETSTSDRLPEITDSQDIMAAIREMRRQGILEPWYPGTALQGFVIVGDSFWVIWESP